jgi:hypothetical protein
MLLHNSRRGYHNRSKKIMGFQRMHAATGVLLATLVSGAVFAGPVKAQSNSQPPATGSGLWDRQINSAAVPADAWFENYKFRSGETLERLKIHYATLGTPRRNANGDIENAVLVLHWTGADSRVLLSPSFTRAFFDADRPLDANRYYLIFPDSVGHGQSSRPSEGLRAKFPNYDYGDIVDLQHKLVTEILGVKRLRAILGISICLAMGRGLSQHNGRGDAGGVAADQGFGPKPSVASHGHRRDTFRSGVEERRVYTASAWLDLGLRRDAVDD